MPTLRETITDMARASGWRVYEVTGTDGGTILLMDAPVDRCGVIVVAHLVEDGQDAPHLLESLAGLEHVGVYQRVWGFKDLGEIERVLRDARGD